MYPNSQTAYVRFARRPMSEANRQLRKALAVAKEEGNRDLAFVLTITLAASETQCTALLASAVREFARCVCKVVDEQVSDRTRRN